LNQSLLRHIGEEDDMTNLTLKKLYAQAVLSGSMTKVMAFTKFINQHHSNPSQGAYKLEHTLYMRKLMSEVSEELTRADSIKRKQLLVTERSLDILNRLLDGCEDKSSQEQLATLRLVKVLARSPDQSSDKDEGDDSDEATSPYKDLDKTGLIS